ncbi:hypothetical protein [Alloacidobacterium sp.]|uniref:hypothetical protein n=1 Tax=Alloacidobacterium sp. TaxID=2951999 RepID=UPI002D4B96A2|nr:hypothetical protein [Alloacidobacterium sp.]HYK35608.1 hypothetical protein [Alloacidobacterium sp.]
MKQGFLLSAIAGLLLAGSMSATAQELGYWRAASAEAKSVTGDVGFSDAKLTIYFSNFDIVHAADLDSAQVSSVFDVDSNNTANKGHLYKMNIPGARKFLHKNTLCEGEDTQWVAAYVEGRTLHLAFFSGQKVPVFTLDAISNSSALCGRYSYER